jgi:hypothetical protein
VPGSRAAHTDSKSEVKALACFTDSMEHQTVTPDDLHSFHTNNAYTHAQSKLLSPKHERSIARLRPATSSIAITTTPTTMTAIVYDRRHSSSFTQARLCEGLGMTPNRESRRMYTRWPSTSMGWPSCIASTWLTVYVGSVRGGIGR